MTINTRDLFGDTEHVNSPLGPQYHDASFFQALLSCKACPIRAEATKVVPGAGPKSAEILFLGRNPGRDEDKLGAPFIGRGGDELNHMFEALGLDRLKCGILNTCKCHTMGDRAPKPIEIEICTDTWLGKELAFFHKAQIIFTLGREATQVMLGSTAESTGKREGYWIRIATPPMEGQPSRTFHVRPLNHPGYILRAPRFATQMYHSTLPAVKLHMQTQHYLREIYDRARAA